jgi:hypothetical protein
MIFKKLIFSNLLNEVKLFNNFLILCCIFEVLSSEFVIQQKKC